MAKQLDAYALKNIDRMSVHEFVSISSFYLGLLSDGVCSKALAEAFLSKIQDSVTEFNELQLVILKTTLEQAFVKERSSFSSDVEA